MISERAHSDLKECVEAMFYYDQARVKAYGDFLKYSRFLQEERERALFLEELSDHALNQFERNVLNTAGCA